MADVAEIPTPASQTPETAVVFRGSPRNMIIGITLLAAGLMAFVMGMTEVFFAEAMAWVFVIWGALFLLNDLLDTYKTWSVTGQALVIHSPIVFWTRKVWDWNHINRMDVIVKRPDPKIEDLELQVYYTGEGESVLHREDRVYSEDLARLIVERARLKPTGAHNPANFAEVPAAKAVYTWNRSGKGASA